MWPGEHFTEDRIRGCRVLGFTSNVFYNKSVEFEGIGLRGPEVVVGVQGCRL